MTYNDNGCLKRAIAEYDSHDHYIVGVDFDSTISPYKDGEDVAEVLATVREASENPKIAVCLWTIASNRDEIERKLAYCEEHGVRISHVNESPLSFGGCRKPYFNLLIDDRAGLESALYVLRGVIDHAKGAETAKRRRIAVFDIDDTLLRSNSDILKIYKRTDDGGEVALTTAEFAEDKDTRDPSKRDMFDYRDFRDPDKVRMSIMCAEPLIRNLRVMDGYINMGYEFSFLTARSCEDVVKDALREFLQVRTSHGTLRSIGESFNGSLCYAVSDESHAFPDGVADSDRKAYVLRRICSEYDDVVFVDDDDKNIESAKSLGLPNLTVIKAFK